MKDEKIVRLPISYEQRKINEMGNGYVPCQISSRWLQFHDESTLLQDGEFIGVDVMTLGTDNEPKKICELILRIEDIKRVLANIKLSE